MPRIHAKAADIFVDEFDYSGFSNAVDIAVDNNLAEVTAFADTDQTFLEGKAGFSITVNGFYSRTDYDAEMWADLTAAARQVGIYPPGVSDGDKGYEGQSIVTGQPRVADKGAAVTLNVGWKGDTPLVRTIVLDVNTALIATGTGTAYQYGAVGASQTMMGVLRVLSASGTLPTLNVLIQSDDNEAFTSPTTRLTFTQATGVTYEVKTAAGAVTDTWWRVSYTVGGTTPSFSVVVSFGIRPT